MAGHHSRITVLVSGGGTNLQALMDACDHKQLASTSIARVISNRKDAYGLTRAQHVGIPTRCFSLYQYKKTHPDETEPRRGYDGALASLILQDEPDLIVCAGFMHILTPDFLDPLSKAGVPIINLHPALPKAFDGAHAIQRAHEAFMKGEIDRTGIMIHYVIAEVDRGEPIIVEEIPLRHPEDDDLDALEQRIHEIEWKAIVEGTQKAIEALGKTRHDQGKLSVSCE